MTGTLGLVNTEIREETSFAYLTLLSVPFMVLFHLPLLVPYLTAVMCAVLHGSAGVLQVQI